MEKRLRIVDLDFLDKLEADYNHIGNYTAVQVIGYLKVKLSSPESTREIISEVYDKGSSENKEVYEQSDKYSYKEVKNKFISNLIKD